MLSDGPNQQKFYFGHDHGVDGLDPYFVMDLRSDLIWMVMVDRLQISDLEIYFVSCFRFYQSSQYAYQVQQPVARYDGNMVVGSMVAR